MPLPGAWDRERGGSAGFPKRGRRHASRPAGRYRGGPEEARPVLWKGVSPAGAGRRGDRPVFRHPQLRPNGPPRAHPDPQAYRSQDDGTSHRGNARDRNDLPSRRAASPRSSPAAGLPPAADLRLKRQGIALVVTRADRTGGAQVHVLHLARALQARGYPVTVLTGPPGPFTDELRRAGIRHRHLPHLIRPIRPLADLRALLELRGALTRLRPALVAAHSTKAGWLARLAACSLGIPCVVTVHGWPFAPPDLKGQHPPGEGAPPPGTRSVWVPARGPAARGPAAPPAASWTAPTIAPWTAPTVASCTTPAVASCTAPAPWAAPAGARDGQPAKPGLAHSPGENARPSATAHAPTPPCSPANAANPSPVTPIPAPATFPNDPDDALARRWTRYDSMGAEVGIVPGPRRAAGPATPADAASQRVPMQPFSGPRPARRRAAHSLSAAPLWLILWGERLLRRLAASVITVCQHDRDLGIRLGLLDPRRAVVIPNGVPLNPRPQGSPWRRRYRLRRRPGPRSRSRSQSPRCSARTPSSGDARSHPRWRPARPALPAASRLVMVARFEEPKDHATLLRAVARLDPSIPWTLDLVGDGPGLPAAAELAQELGIGHRVRFLGARRDVERILAGAAALVLCTWREGLPLAILEAMRAGLPVVASAVGGVPEAVVDGVTGYLVPAGDVDAVAERLARLLSDAELRERLGRAGRQRFEECFSLDPMVNATLAVYRQVLMGWGARINGT